VRSTDEPIPAQEELYRSIEPGHLDGERVLEGGVDMPACSFNRQKYSQPSQVLSPKRPWETSIAMLVASNLPGPIARDNAVPYLFVVADDPCPSQDPENEAHAEVRIAREGTDYDPKHKPPSRVKKQAREALADRMRAYKP
jgi:hypothetical protein